MRRRDLIALIGGMAVSAPVGLRAQQSATASIGFINAASPKSYARPLSAFLKGLAETGYVEGRNVTIEYRWAESRIDRLPAMAADLAHLNVAVIAATTTAAALAAKTATSTIPIVFETAGDPVQLGLVTSLRLPGGNVTGVTQTNVELAAKRLQLLQELLPGKGVIALLVNPADPALAEAQVSEVLSAAHTLGVELQVLKASSESEFDAAFAKLAELRAAGLVIATDPLFTGRSEQLAALAVHYAVPAIYGWREFAAAGGLLSYGAAVTDSYHLAGTYTGRILKGDKPAELPVQQITRVEMYINLKTARALGITIPIPLSGRAEEIFE